MEYIRNHKVATVAVFLILLIVGVGVINFLLIKYGGSPVAVPTIPREPQIIGEGKPLSYAVLGDSTAVGQGGDYTKGITVSTAGFIAEKGYRVTYQNFAISGARAADVRTTQTAKATAVNPDVVLIAVGANDVTHLTRITSVLRDIRATIDALQSTNSDIRIFLTGSPEMGSVPRFPQPTKQLAKLQTARINQSIQKLAQEKGAIFVPIAEKTGPYFAKHPELFAADRFHPQTVGYDMWLPVLKEAIDQTIR